MEILTGVPVRSYSSRGNKSHAIHTATTIQFLNLHEHLLLCNKLKFIQEDFMKIKKQVLANKHNCQPERFITYQCIENFFMLNTQ